MSTTIQANVQVPIADILRAVLALGECEKAGLIRVETEFQREAGQNAAKIYAEAVPTKEAVRRYNARRRGVTLRTARRVRSSGIAWTRTGSLARAIKAPPIWAGPAAVEVKVNLPYGGPRNELGVTRRPKAPALGIVRRQPYWTDAIEVIIPKASDLFAQGFNSKWERG